MTVSILIGTTRTGRMSPRVALMLNRELKKKAVSSRMVDLQDLDVPIFKERLKYLQDPHPGIVNFAGVFLESDTVIVVAPEYNGSYPGVLKNALDHLVTEYKGKKVAIATVSAGPNGGKDCFSALKTFFTRMGARVIEKHLQIISVQETVTQEGHDPQGRYKDDISEFIEILKN